MPNTPYTNPSALDELYRNTLHDLGAPPESQANFDSTSLHGIWQNLDYGVYKTTLGDFGSGVDCTVSSGVEVPLTFSAIANGAGTVTLWNGTTLTASSNTYTLTQDLWLSDGATIATGATINNNGFRIFCQGMLINNGTISGAGSAGSSNTAGAALSYTSTISNTTVGSAGGAGGGAGNGTGGTNQTVSLGGAGGAGGGGNNTANSVGGAGGTVTAPAATIQLPFSLPLATLVRAGTAAGTGFSILTAGSGGGGGGGNGTTNTGGGGGGGGGIVMVCAQRISGTGTISANGGAGGNNNGANSGGGGGGGGGLVIVVSRSVIPGAQTNASATTPNPAVAGSARASVVNQTIAAAGGAGGTAGTGGGATAGTAGSGGIVLLIPA